MKRIAFEIVILVIVSSFFYNLGVDKKELQKNTPAEKTEIEKLKLEIEKLNYRNTDIKEKLDKYIYGDPKRDIIQMGDWFDAQKDISRCFIKLFRNEKTNKTYMHFKYGDDSETTDEMRVSEYKGLKRYELFDNVHNEFYIVEKNGDLSMYGQSGKFRTVTP